MTGHSPAPLGAEDAQRHARRRRRLRRRLRGRLRALTLLLGLLLALSLVWTQSSWREQLEPAALLPRLQSLGATLGPVGMSALMTVALVLAVPLMLLTVLALAALGPGPGMACTLVSGVLAAGISHALGHSLGHAALQRLAGPRVQKISQTLAARGVMAVVLIRWLPIAPFALVNMAAGAGHIRLRDMLLGTLLGMLPATLTLAFFMDTLLQAWRGASAAALGSGFAVIVLLALAGALLRKWARRHTR